MKILKIIGYSILTFFGICILAAIFIPDKKDNNSNAKQSTEIKNQETKEQRDSINKKYQIENTVKAKDLYSIYEKNEIKADEIFKGKKFYVQGKITSIQNDILDNPFIALSSGNDFLSVQCSFNDKKILSELSKGQQVTIYGECNGLLMNVLMGDCILVENYELSKK